MPNTVDTIDEPRRTWLRYAQTRTTEDRNALVVHYAGLVDRHATRVARKLPPQISVDEVRSAAFVGLIQAVENYDPQRNASFETFCQRRVSGAVTDWLRSRDPQSRNIRLFEKERNRAWEMLNAETGRTPAPADIAERMRLPVDRYQELTRISHVGNEIHLSGMESQMDQDHAGATYQWEIPDRRDNDPARDITRQMLTDYIARGLTGDERTIMVLYYYEGLTMAEIGTVMELCESRICQLHKDVLDRLRRRITTGLIEELAI